MKVVTAAEMREIDRVAIRERGVPSLTLMENAGAAVADAIAARAAPGACVAVVCGTGNNGGDGLVAARRLAERGARVTALLAGPADRLSPDARANHGRASALGVPILPLPDAAALREHGAAIDGADVVVDAIFGTGLARPIEGQLAAVIERMNRARGLRVAVDVPSGLDADRGVALGVAFHAALTVSFGHPKVGLVSAPGFARAGEVIVADIGFPSGLAEAVGARLELLDDVAVRALLPRRAPDAHKGRTGHVLVVAGSAGHTGAALLCGAAAMRAGAGLCTVASTPRGQAAIESRAVEVMTAALSRGEQPEASDWDALAPLLGGKAAVAAGPGIPTGAGMAALLARLIAECPAPLVLDADALNHLARDRSALARARAPVCLTPHPGEAARLGGWAVPEVQADRVGAARRLAADTGAFVLLKGARTVIAAPGGEAWINPTGNAAMASGGMGDVLTGVVAALLGQGAGPAAALCAGAYLHGAAGDLARDQIGPIGVVARDVMDRVPRAWARLAAGG